MAAAAASCSSERAGTTKARQSSARCMTLAHTSGSTWSSTLITHGAPTNRCGLPAAQPEWAVPAMGCPPTKRSSSPYCWTTCSSAPLTLTTSVSEQSGAAAADVVEHDRQGGHGDGEHDERVRCRGAGQGLVDAVGRVESVESGCVDAVDRPVVAEHLSAGGLEGSHHRPADQPQAQHADGSRHAPRLAHGSVGQAGVVLYFWSKHWRGASVTFMGAQRAQAQNQAA